MTNREAAQIITERIWPDSWPKIAPSWQKLSQTDEGRHWQHTQRVAKNMDALLASQHQPGQIPLKLPPLAMGWLTASLPALDPAVLQAAALLHDLGKAYTPANHEERSFRLVTPLGMTSPKQTLTALLIRHHARLGAVQTGDISELFLAQLIADVRCFKLDPVSFLGHLVALTIADWAAYNLLANHTVCQLIALGEHLQTTDWWTTPSTTVEQNLHKCAMRNTECRMQNRLSFAFLQHPPTSNPDFANQCRSAIQQAGMPWEQFQDQFARLCFDGGYQIFWRLLQLLPNEQKRLRCAASHLLGWLAYSPASTPNSRLTVIKLRSLVTHLEQMDLTELNTALAQITPQPYQSALATLAQIDR